jgi:hypothetical protein
MKQVRLGTGEAHRFHAVPHILNEILKDAGIPEPFLSLRIVPGGDVAGPAPGLKSLPVRKVDDLEIVPVLHGIDKLS